MYDCAQGASVGLNSTSAAGGLRGAALLNGLSDDNEGNDEQAVNAASDMATAIFSALCMVSL